MALTSMRLVDWLDDLCVRFIINLPVEELSSVERICFQIEEAQWFYEDFVRPLDPSLPSMNLFAFCMAMFKHCPLTASYPHELHESSYKNFLAYKTRVPVRGAIMLNDDMTKAVLVKGWKKSAKWSFPRGKINKGEPDLDCAVREVYEETGFDLKAAGLVRPEKELKKIPVSMREQEMVLYVFRGVPADAHFEPRTRKEISKIDWYNISDLPTAKRRNQVQQISNGDLKDNMFYMVAPFLGPLRQWINRQHKIDRQKQHAGGRGAHGMTSGVTDTEDIDAGDTTTDDAPPAEVEQKGDNAPLQRDDNLANLLANLGRGHRSSDTLPEVSAQQSGAQSDPAAELKRLLSVGGEQAAQTPPVEAPTLQEVPPFSRQINMLQSNSGPPPPISNPDGLFRQQLTSNGPAHQQPHQPSNGGAFHSQLPSNSPAPPQPQYPPNISHIPPPPPFGFSAHGAPFREPQHSHVPQQQVQAMAMPTPRHFVAAPPSQHPPTFSAHGPSIHHRFTPDSNTRPYQRTGDRDPQFAPPPQFPGVHGPTIPPASKLPLPKLTPHALGLLNAFKNPEKPAQVQAPPSQPSQSAYTTPRMQPAPALHRDVESFASASAVSSANPYAPSPPPFQSPAASANLQQAQPQLMGAQQPFQSPTANLNMQPAQPKPMSSHHDSLLNLFRSPSAAAATPPANSRLEPVELSAQPHTPGDTQLPSVSGGAARPISDTSKKPNGSATNGAANQQYDLTSATVSGPVNVPDFETVKKHAHVDGHSRGPSPAQPKDAQNKPFVPQILKRDPGKPKSPAEMGVSKKPAAVAPTPPKPMQILKRPSRGTAPVPTPIATRPLRSSVPPEKRALVPADGPVHAPSVPKTTADAPKFDKRDVLPTDQKNALLSLFGKPAISAASPVPPPKPNMPPQVLSKAPSGLVSLLSKSPLPKSPQPATPKSVVSGIISPVSPLPDKGSQVNSPAQLASRSRISSIGDGTLPGITASDEGRVPVDAAHAQSPPGATRSNGHANLEEGYKSTDTAASSQRSILAAPEKKKEPATSPMDASFLRGFLEDVARRGR